MLTIYEIATGGKSRYLIKTIGRPKAPHMTDDNLHSILSKHRSASDNIVVFLDEKHFVMAHSHQSVSTSTTYTANNLHENCLALGKHLNNKYHIPGKPIYCRIDNITANKEHKEHLIGSRGNLSRDSTYIYLKNNTIPLVESHWNNITILPQSLSTIHHITQKIKKTSFCVVWIHNNYVKIVSVENNQYKSSHTINRGKKKLVEMVTENGVWEYFLQPNKHNTNPIAQKLLKDSFDFYCKMIVQEIPETPHTHGDLIVISKLTSYDFFMQSLKQQYSKKKKGYIVPVHPPTHPDKYLTISDIRFMLANPDYLKKHLIPLE